MKKVALSSPPPAAAPVATPQAKLAELVACLQQPQPLAANPSFSSGQLGPFLLLYAYAAHTGCPAAAAATQRLLHTAVRQFVALAPSPTRQ